jgi:MoxR-like ATPase
VLAHRLVLTAEAQASRRSSAELIRNLIQRVPVPVPQGAHDPTAQWAAGRRR